MGLNRFAQAVLVVIVAMLSVLPSAPVHATSWYVTPSGNDGADCLTASTPCLTINGAITKAAGEDTVLVSVGTYTVNSGDEVILLSKSLILSGGWDADFATQGGTSIIDGGGARRGVNVTKGSVVTADRFTIQHGFNVEFYSGGGIINEGTLSLRSCIVTDNIGGTYGGGIFNVGTLSLDDCVITNNHVSGGGAGIDNGGGGIQISATATINNCVITDNHSSRLGGGINNAATLALNNCAITNNNADNQDGGGVKNVGTLTLDNCVVNYNVGWAGGGISNFLGTLVVNRTTISGNIAGIEGDGRDNWGGGGIYVGNGTVVLNDSTVSGNIVRGSFPGSGISANFCSLQVNNSTLSGNSGGYGEGIYYFSNAPYQSMTLNNSTISQNEKWGMRVDRTYVTVPNVTVRNTIIAGNGANNDCHGDGWITSGGYNLIGSGEDCPIAAVPGDQIGSSSEPVDALLLPLRAYGGPTMTHALRLGSPALDAGNPAAPGSGGNACLATDQRGQLRPEGNACDIGAFEGRVAAVASIKRAGPSPSAASSIGFIVTFSEPVTGVNVSAPFNDFALVTTGVAGASITFVTDNGDDSYTVSVATGTGDGTIRLDLVDDDSILDAGGNPLGSPGAGNGDFADGEIYDIYWNPRVISIVRTDSDATNAMSVDFTVAFSEPVTGLDTIAPFSDFALATTGVTGASVTAVSGSGETYTVSVQTGSGNGTIRLDLVDGDSIQDAGGNPLGGPGVGNGDFTGGESYIIRGIPYVTSVVRADSDPTSADSVDFTVTFSEPVTGVDLTPPFGDFAVTTTGAASGVVSTVSGYGYTYTVTLSLSPDSGNGTIRLDIVDDDSIEDASGDTLGGEGTGNGNFTSGEPYTILRVIALLSPTGRISTACPTYEWTRVPRARRYRYQLFKGSTLVYSKIVSSKACGNTTCSDTPTTRLRMMPYKWRVQAQVDGRWKRYSAYETFTVSPRAGIWLSDYHWFSVTLDLASVSDFTLYIYVDGCGEYIITHPDPVPIVNNRFAFEGDFYASGTFSSPYRVSGKIGLRMYYLEGCGHVYGGPFSWTGNWVWPPELSPDASADSGRVSTTPTPAYDVDPLRVERVDP